MSLIKFLAETAALLAIVAWFTVHMNETWAVPVVIGVAALIGINNQLTQLIKRNK